MNQLIPQKSAVSLLLVILTCFGLLPGSRAVSPPPDGGYPNENTAEGHDALFSLTLGQFNTAVGSNALYSNTTGFNNTATGAEALRFNTDGGSNTATGFQALLNNTAGTANTANGMSAMMNSRSGSQNTAIGVQALYNNSSGGLNTASGDNALFTNSSGNSNTAAGSSALYKNTTGHSNTANGVRALFHNTTGLQNTANGVNALFNNRTGNGNVAEGDGTLGSNSGSFNTALGDNAGANLTTGSDNIDIGALGVAGESNTTRIGTVRQTSTFITGIRGVTTRNVNAIPVLIDSAGQLGTQSSSRRYKIDIQTMDKSSEDILALKPVTFHYKSDKTSTPQFGLIAEEVAAVNPDLVVRDQNGEIYTVRYEAVNAMLLNEFLKEHSKNQEQEATIAQLNRDSAEQQKQIEALSAGLQKVSAQLELRKPEAQTVLNNH